MSKINLRRVECQDNNFMNRIFLEIYLPLLRPMAIACQITIIASSRHYLEFLLYLRHMPSWIDCQVRTCNEHLW
jgi:hypothetical protein